MSSHTHKLVNGVEVPLTIEELNNLEARDAEYESLSFDRAFTAIDEKYAKKFAPLRELMVVAFIADGVDMNTNLEALRTRWQEIVAERAAELDALFEGV